ncbi:hypothetical protein CLV71_11921 [Actinophytocola oryzae]|uniref:Uncharacterized protein n=1 Tax=Actinophytocola oryzae TaxID=502181 RepID=A0A4R7UXX5_9PSEU|nr:hypothetical protein CLV71_11921 [Actinophytocola oryzae]
MTPAPCQRGRRLPGGPAPCCPGWTARSRRPATIPRRRTRGRPRRTAVTTAGHGREVVDGQLRGLGPGSEVRLAEEVLVVRVGVGGRVLHRLAGWMTELHAVRRCRVDDECPFETVKSWSPRGCRPAKWWGWTGRGSMLAAQDTVRHIVAALKTPSCLPTYTTDHPSWCNVQLSKAFRMSAPEPTSSSTDPGLAATTATGPSDPDVRSGPHTRPSISSAAAQSPARQAGPPHHPVDVAGTRQRRSRNRVHLTFTALLVLRAVFSPPTE